MKSFKNKEILRRLDKVLSDLEESRPEVRKQRIDYMKEMLIDYRQSEERFPQIERQLEKAILEKGKPSSVDVKELEREKKRLESKL